MSDNISMNQGLQSGPKLTTALRMKVLAMLARGERHHTIRRILSEKYDIELSNAALTNIRKTHADTIHEMELMILEAETSEAEQIRVKALRQLGKKLDRAAEDDSEIAELDRQYRDGEIEDLAEYRRRKTGLLKLNVIELSKISKEMNAQAGPKTPGALPNGSPDGSTPDPKWVEALMLAVQRGDTIALQQLVITPNA